MSKKITDKIKELLTPEDLQTFEEAIESMISERVGAKVSLMEEEMKTKYDTIAEEYVEKQVAEKLEAEKAELMESYDAKLNSLEKKVVAKLDSFIEHVVKEQISDEAIKSIALNEVTSPIVDGIKKVFGENYVELDSNTEATIKESESKISDLETKYSESLDKNMKLEERLEKTATYLLISEKTEGLTVSQKKRVVNMFKDKAFDEVKEKIDDFIGIVKESNEKKEEKAEETTEEKTIVDEIVAEGDTIEETKVIVEDVDDAEVTPKLGAASQKYL